MTPAQSRMWESIRIPPVKWREPTYGNAGGGFWVVAIFGATVIWFNDIEEGFNCSRYSSFRRIDGYACEQDELEYAVQRVLNQLCKSY